MMRRVFAAVALLALLTTGCKKVGTKKEEVGAAIYKTETVPRTYVYQEDASDKATVRAQIADDYKYSLTGRFGRYYADEVVVDDARAQRSNDARFYEGSLKTGSWVVDPKGANELWSHPSATLKMGDNPLYDALSVLRYVRTAIGEASDVVLFNPESQDYRPKFDPFPRPESGTERYDVVAPALKPRDASTAVGQTSQLPGIRYFRRMALYVRDGRVVEIRERVSVYSALSDPRSHIAARIGDYGITLPKGSLRVQARYLTDAMNSTAQRLGLPEIRERSLDVKYVNFGATPTIHLPSGSRASLRTFNSLGQVLYEKTG